MVTDYRARLRLAAGMGLLALGLGCRQVEPAAATRAATAVPPSAHLPAEFAPAAVAEAFGRHLDEEVLPFWTDPRVVDAECGGFLPGFDADGHPTDPEVVKPLIVHLRLLFVHAVAIQRCADDARRERLRRQYDQGFEFLVSRYLDPQAGGWYFGVDRRGAVTDASKQGVAQAYAVYVLSEIAARICDSRARRLAIASQAWLDEHAHDPVHGGYVEYGDRPLDDPANATKAVGTNMHVALGLARLFRIAPSGQARERLEELLRLLTAHALVAGSDNGRMYVTRDWRPSRAADMPAHQQTLYGHNAELAWYLEDVAEALGRPALATRSPAAAAASTAGGAELTAFLQRVGDGVLRQGLMADGGVYVWGPLAGRGTDPDDIRWWPQTEAMIMLVRLYRLTGEARYWEAFERVTRFTFGHLVVDRSGAWLGGVNRRTGEHSPRGGWAWKSGLHVSRAMLECERALRELERPAVVRSPPRARPRRAVQIEPGFAYYRERSAASIVSEVRANGFDAIHLICLSDRVEPPDLVAEARRQGVEVWGTFFPSGVYMPAALFGPQADEWRMQFTTDRSAHLRFYSYVHPGYREWWRRHLVAMCERYPFDGVLFYEVHYPTYAAHTIGSGTPMFGDVSPGFAAAFRRATGHGSAPDFTDLAGVQPGGRQRGLYEDWVEFRLRSIVDFQREVLDGPDGLRRRFPERLFATWTIALAQPDGPAAMREYESQDAPRFVVELQPDAHIFQSHYPDWWPRDQRADYIRGYEPYIRAVREVCPGLPLGAQADVCSTLPYRRDPAWMSAWQDTARDLGLAITTYYEFSLRWAVYAAAPVATAATLSAAGEAQVVFDQRLEAAGAQALVGRDLGGGVRVAAVAVDGNRLDLRIAGPLRPGDRLDLPIGGLAGDVAARLPMPEAGRGEPKPVPPGTTVALTVAAPWP